MARPVLLLGAALTLSCSSGGRNPADTAPVESPPANEPRAEPERPAPSGERAAELFAGCRVTEKEMQGGTQHFIECADGVFQILTITEPGLLDRSDEELLSLAVSQSGREVERGSLTFAGSEHDFRRYEQKEQGAERPAISGLVTIHREAERLRILHCISTGHRPRPMDDRTCASRLGAIVRDGISSELLAATAARESGARIDIEGTAIELPGCRRRGTESIKCDNGQLSWKSTGGLAQAQALMDSEGERLTSELPEQGGRVEQDREPACRFLDRPASCRQLDLYLGSASLGTLRVFLIAAETAGGGVFAACSYYPDKEPPARRDELPLPCSKVMSLQL